ncbi:hypothetical protein L0947_02495 [Paracidovorax citrulli]
MAHLRLGGDRGTLAGWLGTDLLLWEGRLAHTGAVQLEQRLPEREARLSGFPCGQVADRGLRTSGGTGNLGLSPAPAGLDFCDNGVPLHGDEDNVFPLFYQRISVIGTP